MRAPLEITERSVASVTILELVGRLVVDDGERQLEDRVASLVAAGRANLLMDLRHVRYIDSGGVGALASMLLHVVHRGGHLKLLSPSARVDQVLRMTQVIKAFEVFADEATAVESFSIIGR